MVYSCIFYMIHMMRTYYKVVVCARIQYMRESRKDRVQVSGENCVPRQRQTMHGNSRGFRSAGDLQNLPQLPQLPAGRTMEGRLPWVFGCSK